MNLPINIAHASSPGAIGVMAEVIWYANMLGCIPFLVGGIVALIISHKTKLRRNFAFIMGVLNILIGIASSAYWILARVTWIIPFLIPTALGIMIITKIYKENNQNRLTSST